MQLEEEVDQKVFYSSACTACPCRRGERDGKEAAAAAARTREPGGGGGGDGT